MTDINPGPISPLPPVSDHAVVVAHQTLLKSKDLQFSFPDQVPLVTPSWAIWLRDLLEKHGFLLKYLYYGGAILLGLVVLYFLVRFIQKRGWSSKAVAKEEPMWPAWQPSVEQARKLLRDADALAERGIFDEAVHVLLLGSIQEIGDRRAGLLLPAFTSREIANLPALSVSARSVFSEIARVVEKGIFAGRPVSVQDFAHCRRAFEQFSYPEHWQTAA